MSGITVRVEVAAFSFPYGLPVSATSGIGFGITRHTQQGAWSMM